MRVPFLVPLFTLGLGGCLPDPQLCSASTWFHDVDGDGAGDATAPVVACEEPDDTVTNGDDCDDSSAEIGPDQAEIWYDGVDQDCSGGADDDQDGDGYGALEAGGDDCDDADPEVSPSAGERWYDGVDSDCDGADDDDADGDGYTADAVGGADCDDADDAVNPGALEICSDGLDNDCDGLAGADCSLSGELALEGSDSLLLGEDAGDEAGQSVRFAGDTDGDGRPDLIVGAISADGDSSASGAAYLVSGATVLSGTQSLSRATGKLLGSASDDLAGGAVSGLGDLDDDAYDDVAVGAYGAELVRGDVYVLLGPVDENMGIASAQATLRGTSDGSQAGYALANADGFTGEAGALLVGAPKANDSGGLATGAAYLATGALVGRVALSSTSLVISGSRSGDGVGTTVAGGADLDGDGVPDILVGAPGFDGVDTDAGGVFGFFGPASGSVTISDADLRVVSADAGAAAGTAASVGDLDGDGYDDIAVGAYKYSSTSIESGAIYLISGPRSGLVSLDWVSTRIEGDQSYGWFGAAITGVGDLNGDSYGDIAVGEPGRVGGEAASAITLYEGPISGPLTTADATATVTASDDSRLGVSLDGGGDMNGDGYSELLMGVPSLDDAGRKAGGVYVLGGGGL